MRFLFAKKVKYLQLYYHLTQSPMTTLTPEEQSSLLTTLKSRFEDNMSRHTGLIWTDIESRLISESTKLATLALMESTGGEPDVIGYDSTTDVYLYVDCSTESPVWRRSLCYDQVALDGRKENKPKDSAMGMANSMGATLLTEDEYRTLQSLGKFDMKTSSWIATPENIRKLGGALFSDRRYDAVFTYHNGADSYYAARGWRGMVRV